MKEVPKGSPLEKGILSFFYGCWSGGQSLATGTRTPVFPGPLPVSIERRHFVEFQKQPYLVCEKTDGTRYCMVCFMFDNKKCTALINRALDVWTVNLQMPKRAYQGSLLDGELIDNKFLVYDCIWAMGEDFKMKNFVNRYEALENLVTGIMRLSKDPISVQVKHFELLENFQHYYEEVVPKLEHKTDGFIFTPVNEPIRMGTHETMFKWKPLEKNTIDFQAKWHPYLNKWGFYIQEKGRLVFETEYEGPGIEENDILECKYKGSSVWEPISKRTDKNYPNNRRTFYRTLVNIKENIQVREFFKTSLFANS